MNLCNPAVIREVMARAGIRFRHEYGQNFLIDPTVPQRIAEMCADDPESLILEIGPGVGSLTAELAQRYRKVAAVEIDRGLIPVLAETLAEYDNVTVTNSDIMNVDLPSFLAEQSREGEAGGDTKVSVCANLPYYITTPILMRLLECGVPFSTITVMVQKEVAARLTAKPGKSDYGAITAVIGYYGTVRKLFDIPRSAFLPAPKVDSAVIRIDLYEKPPFQLCDVPFFFGILHGAFEMRRKTLTNAISAKYPSLPKQEIAKALTAMNLDENIRGERLSVAEFATLSNCLYPIWHGTNET